MLALTSSSPSTSSGQGPSVCLVMIVRDSGHDIMPVLQSVSNYITNYYIADTGSVDDTKSYIQRYLTVPGTLVDHEWVDFSHNRNRVLAEAESTYGSDFYLMLDDSYILNGGQHLVDELRKLDPRVSANYLIRIFDTERFYYSARLTTKGQRYKYRIHECLESDSSGSLGDEVYLLDHLSALHQQRSKKRYDRDIEWLLADHRDFPDDPRPVYYLGRTYYIKDDLAHAVEAFQLRIRMARPEHSAGTIHEIYNSMFFLAVIAYKKFLAEKTKEAFSTAVELLRKCMSTFPYRAEPMYYLATIMTYFEYEARKDEILEILEKAVTLEIPQDNDVHYDIYKTKLPYTLAFAYYRRKQFDKAIETIKKYYPVGEANLRFDNLLVGMGAMKPYSIQHFSEPLVVINAGKVVSQPWNGAQFNKFCSGSEHMAVRLAEYFASCGKRVALFCECTGLETDVNGVSYIHISKYYPFLRTHYVDVLVVSRDASQLSYLRHIRNVFLWVHDTEPIGDEFQTGPSFRGLISLSQWHKQHLLSAFPMPEQYIRVIGNAIVPIPELLSTPKIPLRFVYASSPDRGLERVVQCIERLAQTMPVSLSVFANEELIDGRTRAIMQRAPSRYLVRPRVSKEELHKAYAESDYWLYTTHFEETSCLVAVEAQYYKCVCVTTALAALRDTVGDRGVMLQHKAEQPEVIDEVVTKIEFLEKHPAIKELYRQKGHEWAAQQVMPELGKKWDSLIQL